MELELQSLIIKYINFGYCEEDAKQKAKIELENKK